MASTGTRNNILAGGFLIGALALAVASSFIIKGIDVAPKTMYRVYFPMSVGASGLQPGSAVNLGGREVGQVATLRFYTQADAEDLRLEALAAAGTEGQNDGEDGTTDGAEDSGAANADQAGGENARDRIAGIEVEIEIDSTIPLFDNAQVFLEKQLLGSGSEINIASVGNPDARGVIVIGGDVRLAEGEGVLGRVAAPAFLRDAGLGPTEQKMISATIENVHNIVADVSAEWPGYKERIDETLENVRVGTGQFRDASARIDGWSAQVDTVLTNAETLSERFVPFADDAQAGLDEVRAGIADGRSAVATVRETIETNAPKVDQTMDQVVDATAGFRDDVVPNATRTLEDAQGFLARLDSVVAESAPSFRRILANGRLAADQLKLATIEVRSQPWRLLYQPTTKETDEQLLYDSARTYATAVSDLRAASESLEALVAAQAAGNAGLRSAEEIDRVRQELDTAFQRYTEAERRLLDKLVGRQ